MSKRIVRYVFAIMFCLSSLLFINSCSQEVGQKTNSGEENDTNEENDETSIGVSEDVSVHVGDRQAGYKRYG